MSKLNAPQPDKPSHLDAIAAAKWDELVGFFVSRSQPVDDTDLLEQYCLTYSGYREALENVRKTGQVLLSRNDDGKPEAKQNPYSVELHKYADRLTRLRQQLGLDSTGKYSVRTKKTKFGFG